jgi:hypothetical protein
MLLIVLSLYLDGAGRQSIFLIDRQFRKILEGDIPAGYLSLGGRLAAQPANAIRKKA